MYNWCTCHFSMGYKYLNFIFLDTFSDVLPILSSSQKFVSIFHDIMHGSDILWRIRQIPLCRNLISEIPDNCFHNLLLSEEMTHRNNELLLISTHLRSLMFRSSSIQSFSFSLLLDISFVHIFSLFLESIVSYRQSSKR